jgi:phage gp29-like protein
MKKRRNRPAMPDNKQVEIIAPAPQDVIKAPLVGDYNPLREEMSRQIDLYVYANPQMRNMGAVRAVSTYPHYLGGYYHADAGLYFLYEEMLHKDGHLFGLIHTRIMAILSSKRSIKAASSDPFDQTVADFVRDSLDNIGGGGFSDVLTKLLFGMAYGISILEIEWSVAHGGLAGTIEKIEQNPDLAGHTLTISDAVLPIRLRHRHPGYFIFNRDGDMFMWQDEKTPLDPRRFVVYRHDSLFDNPYGIGLLARMIFLYWFKKNAITFWNLAAEKIGTPTLLGKYPGQFGSLIQSQMMDILSNISHDSIAAIPDEWKIDILKAANDAGAFGEGLRGLCTFLNDEMSRLVTGSTLTSGEGARSGSMALGKVHNEVRGEKLKADATELMQVINRQLIRPLVDYNFGPNVAAPTLDIDTDEGEDLSKASTQIKELVSAGAKIPQTYVYTRFNIPEPADGEEILVPQSPVAAPPPDPFNIPADPDAPAEFAESKKKISVELRESELARLAILSAAAKKSRNYLAARKNEVKSRLKEAVLHHGWDGIRQSFHLDPKPSLDPSILADTIALSFGLSRAIEARRLIQAARPSHIEVQGQPVHVTPSPAQKEAGNYKKAHLKFAGLDLSVENPAGSVRSGKDKSGKHWESTLTHHYGYIRGTIGKDKDHLDFYLKDDAQENAPVFIVNQIDPATGKFDEHKVLFGFQFRAEAERAYLSNYAEGWQGLGSTAELTMDEFKHWLKYGAKNRPVFGAGQVASFAEQSPWLKALQIFLGKKEIDAIQMEKWLNALEQAVDDGLIPTYDAAYADAYDSAFTMVRESEQLILYRVDDLIEKSIRGNLSPEDFVQDTDDLYRSLGLDPQDGWYNELVYNNATNRAWQQGMDSLSHDIDAKSNQTPRDWVWGYEWHHGDSAAPRPTHIAMDNYVAPKENSVWNTFTPPPIAHNCSCSRWTIGLADAARRGLADLKDFETPTVKADDLRAYGLSDDDVKKYSGQDVTDVFGKINDKFTRSHFNIPERPILNPSLGRLTPEAEQLLREKTLGQLLNSMIP